MEFESYSVFHQSAFESKEAYDTSLELHEDSGKVESMKDSTGHLVQVYPYLSCWRKIFACP